MRRPELELEVDEDSLNMPYIFGTIDYTYIVPNRFQAIGRLRLTADLVVFPGGGYLRSKKGITQSLNLLMYLAIFYFAKLGRAKLLVAPISFGPFAYKWHERISAHVLKKSDVIMVREKISFEMINPGNRDDPFKYYKDNVREVLNLTTRDLRVKPLNQWATESVTYQVSNPK